MEFELSALASGCLAIISMGLLLRICWTDFFHLKIWNTDLLALLCTSIILLIITRPPDLGLRFGVASLFFGLSFVFWIFKYIGAGDVKLFGVVGILIEPHHALTFILLNLAFVAIIHLAYQRSTVTHFMPQVAGRRILALVDTGLIPYGVAITLSAATLLLYSLIGFSAQ